MFMRDERRQKSPLRLYNRQFGNFVANIRLRSAKETRSRNFATRA